MFDNDDTLKEIEEAEVHYCSPDPETLKTSDLSSSFLRKDDRLIGIVVEKSHCVVSW